MNLPCWMETNASCSCGVSVLSELTDDVLDVVFIDQKVVFHGGSGIHPLFCAVQDLLLVMERDCGSKGQEWTG